MLIKIQILINKTRNIDKKTKMNNKVKIHTFQYLKKKKNNLYLHVQKGVRNPN